MPSPAERFLSHLDAIFEVEPEFHPIDPATPGMPRVTAIVYRDIPEPGFITGFTFGLSAVAHPAWKHGRSELTISVESNDLAWPLAVATVASGLRGQCPFSYGDVIDFGEPIAEGSEMSAFFLFVPSIIERDGYLDVDVGPYKINIAAAYPMYDDEQAMFRDVGLEAFWKHPDFDMYDVRRSRVRPA